jgi:outer membrane protein assembly factor BamE (lipoprotein component of BamABCDE complex)
MWQKLKEGMMTRQVSEILGEPPRIVSDSRSEIWHYSRDTGVNARVDFDKKLMRFRVESWVEQKK